MKSDYSSNRDEEDILIMPLVVENQLGSEYEKNYDSSVQGHILQIDGLKSKSLQDFINQFPDPFIEGRRTFS